ncbi:MAG: single-stranded DNA-binding protein [Hyphomonadaceae bacterium]|nr:single-stranded DNA-binding protein [Hyphomonadaceae bacterium]
MTDIIMIPLSKLIESEDNVRRANRKGGIAELASSIKAHGLLQSVVVRDTGKGRYAVVAGGRRLRALRMLAKAGDIQKNAPIPCRIVTGDNAAELSLAENVVRQDMAPVDELECFAKLIEAGDGPEAIAARFGVSPMHVARRLKLARVSPRLIEALRKDTITLDQLAALAFTDDHAAQEAAFFDSPDWAHTPERLKAQVTQAHVPETDKLVRFVGIDAYHAEGGAVVRDLFAEEHDESTRWLTDRALLTTLAEAKLAPIAEDIRAEGWAWIEIALDGVAWSQFPERVRERRRALSAEETAEQDRLYAQLDATADEAEIARIENAIDAFASSSWSPQEVALAGAIVTLSHDGAPKIERGLVKADDMKALRALRRKLANPDDAGEADAAATVMPESRLPTKLVDELMAHKTLALRAEITRKPDLALRLVVFTLAGQFVGCDGVSCLGLTVEAEDVSRSITRCESRAAAAHDQLIDEWRARLPSDAEALWSFVRAADHDTLFSLLAVAIAPGIDLRHGPHTLGAEARLRVELVCEAAELDMAKWWSATPESYFDHVRKDVLIDAIKEEKPTLDRSKLEKDLQGRADCAREAAVQEQRLAAGAAARRRRRYVARSGDCRGISVPSRMGCGEAAHSPCLSTSAAPMLQPNLSPSCNSFRRQYPPRFALSSRRPFRVRRARGRKGPWLRPRMRAGCRPHQPLARAPLRFRSGRFVKGVASATPADFAAGNGARIMDRASFEIVGNVGAVEIKEIKGGRKIAILSVATSERWKRDDGDWAEKTYWHRVAVFAPAKIERVEAAVQKGTRVRLVGQVRPGSYEDDKGRTKYVVEFVVGPFGDLEVLARGKPRDNAEPARPSRRGKAAAAGENVESAA